MTASNHSIKSWVWLDGRRMKDREALHERLKVAFDFPDYYGRNLDALWDLLSTWGTPLDIFVMHTEELDNYGLGFLALLRELEKEQPRIRVYADTSHVLPQENSDMLYSV